VTDVRRPGLLVVALLGILGMVGCAALDEDTANATVCDTVLGQAGPMLDQARAQPQDAGALAGTLSGLHDALEVRDSDASDQMRGDALVLQLNLRKAQEELAADGSTSAGRLEDALGTFRSRECT
jgi:hypothetical protein